LLLLLLLLVANEPLFYELWQTGFSVKSRASHHQILENLQPAFFWGRT